jgi:hypothetical protein
MRIHSIFSLVILFCSVIVIVRQIKFHYKLFRWVNIFTLRDFVYLLLTSWFAMLPFLGLTLSARIVRELSFERYYTIDYFENCMFNSSTYRFTFYLVSFFVCIMLFKHFSIYTVLLFLTLGTIYSYILTVMITFAMLFIPMFLRLLYFIYRILIFTDFNSIMSIIYMSLSIVSLVIPFGGIDVSGTIIRNLINFKHGLIFPEYFENYIAQNRIFNLFFYSYSIISLISIVYILKH